ncbi:Serine/threonine protein phosphatase [Caballeronia glathei]|uniref:Serine/threonine protein phosphatase n=1 Tax=Caballeronia glathei TaxID=60547 RepID=A0A069PNV4_9BURK|nr:metallophosphoesterase [Caballeronia glathei]KDR41554.1 serine/threonine protein phosphatase [Caballeronia glathei]CDY79459.1 Serine/threonine protein phosphatase [Caballeronia glathei]
MSFVKRFERNTVGRDFAVGDIHGHFTALQNRLAQIGFNRDVDRLFSVGDLVDRGPESDNALEWIDLPWFHAVRGNHEDMAIRWPSGNMDSAHYAANGGGWNVSNPRYLQLAFSGAFDALPIAMEVETEAGLVGIVHADCPFPTWRDFTVSIDDSNLSNKMRKAIFEAALWSRERIQDEDRSGVAGIRALIVGHTPLKNPAVLGNVHYIDTGGWFRDGYFTLIDLSTLETIPPIPGKLDWAA